MSFHGLSRSHCKKNSTRTETTWSWNSYLLIEKLWISFYMELEQLPSVGKLWISQRHGVITVTFWWGSYESAHSICASSMLMKLQVKKAVVSRHW